MIKEATGGEILAPIPENIPERLTERPQWLVWYPEERGGKSTKVPYEPVTRCRASTMDLMTWGTFRAALGDHKQGVQDAKLSPALLPPGGIGFVFSSADPFCGIDLDHCRDPETGLIEPWAQKIIDEATEGYVEVSPSGTGVHIIVEGKVRGGGMRKGPIEMYSRGRFFTITGVLL